uniref:Nkap_C domain-containing protein n=1 Tax=Syphacia muris TaxID=451379 RepID=A0A0N5AAQ9_9BILA
MKIFAVNDYFVKLNFFTNTANTTDFSGLYVALRNKCNLLRYEKMEAEQMEENQNLMRTKGKRGGNRGSSSSSSSSSSRNSSINNDGRKSKKKHKKKESSKKEKENKHKKHSVTHFSINFLFIKKKKKKKHVKSSDDDDEWVEVTNEMRQAEAEREKQKEAELIGPAIPDHLLQKDPLFHDRGRYGKDMLRGEAAAMAAYIAQGKRIPRRGEIGLSSAEIADFEKIGYVMSGTRHKSMEATRLRKENQVMTAEEKRVLSGFTQEERKKKEELVLQQFRSFVDSKKSKG